MGILYSYIYGRCAKCLNVALNLLIFLFFFILILLDLTDCICLNYHFSRNSEPPCNIITHLAPRTVHPSAFRIRWLDGWSFLKQTACLFRTVWFLKKFTYQNNGYQTLVFEKVGLARSVLQRCWLTFWLLHTFDLPQESLKCSPA